MTTEYLSTKITKTFTYKNKQVRMAIGQNGEAWFVVKDVCEIIGYSNLVATELLANIQMQMGQICFPSLELSDTKPNCNKVTNREGLYWLIRASKMDTKAADNFRHFIRNRQKDLEDMIRKSQTSTPKPTEPTEPIEPAESIKPIKPAKTESTKPNRFHRHTVTVEAEDHNGHFRAPIVIRIYGTETPEQALVRALTNREYSTQSFADVCAERGWTNGRWELDEFAKAM